MAEPLSLGYGAQSHSGHRGAAALSGLALFLASALLLALTMHRVVNPYDEGFVVFDAWRILNGDRLYRDFWTQHAPGQFFVLAFLFKLFGPTILVERCWDMLVKAGIMVLTYTLIADLAPRRTARAFAVLGWGLSGVWLAFLGNHGFPLFPAVLFGLLGAWCAIRYFHDPSALRLLVASGVSTGIAAAFRHDIGFYVALSTMLVLAAHAGFARPRPTGMPAWRALAPLSAYAFSVLLIVVPIAALLLAFVPWSDLVFSLFTVPGRIYPPVRAMPFPPVVETFDRVFQGGHLAPLAELAVYWPFFAVAAALASLSSLASPPHARARPAGGRGSPLQWSLLLLVVLALLLYVKGIVRTSALHMSQSILVGIVLCCVVLSHLRSIPRLAQAVTLAATVAFAVPWAAALDVAAAKAGATMRAAWSLKDRNPCRPPAGLEAMACFELQPGNAAALSHVVARTSATDTIYVGTGRHDLIFVNNVTLYFVARRPAPTKWHQLHPGLQTSAPIQAQMVEELRAREPRFVLLDTRWDAVREPNASAVSSGVTLLDDFLRANYAQVATFDTVRVLEPVNTAN